ncbi:MAG TPA: hypothetical protein VF020_24540 [Chthoniobacterales bacterium]
MRHNLSFPYERSWALASIWRLETNRYLSDYFYQMHDGLVNPNLRRNMSMSVFRIVRFDPDFDLVVLLAFRNPW